MKHLYESVYDRRNIGEMVGADKPTLQIQDGCIV